MPVPAVSWGSVGVAGQGPQSSSRWTSPWGYLGFLPDQCSERKEVEPASFVMLGLVTSTALGMLSQNLLRFKGEDLLMSKNLGHL